MRKKTGYLLLGIAMIILGILTLLIDEMIFLLCGIALIIYGIGNLINWKSRRKNGTANGWGLAGSLLSIAAGAAVPKNDGRWN